jgi:hypothetical protein
MGGGPLDRTEARRVPPRLPPPPPPDRLADRRHTTAIVRLVLDWRGKLHYGEAVQIGGAAGAAMRSVRFDCWRRLPSAIRECLRTAPPGRTPPP